MERSEQPQFVSRESKEKEIFRDLRSDDEEQSPTQYTEKELAEIEQKRQVLSSLAYFIGKDFQIPVELNEHGAGWHWDFKENKIRIDPADLLEKPMDYLRFVISHEGGHRRISRTESIPLETWQKPGFSFMMNAIEDPRDNNFVAENYPKFRSQMDIAYQSSLDLEQNSKEKADKELGYQPRFMQSGFEYIEQWYREQRGEEFAINADLPDDVREVIEKTLEAASDSWWRYPSREEADRSEDTIKRYAEASYRINLERIWPEFQKLVEKDMEDQKMQEFLNQTQEGQGEGGEGLPQDLKNELSSEEQKSLEEAIEQALKDAQKEQGQTGEEGQKGKPVNLDSLSDELKQKIKDYIDSLPEDRKKELTEKAKQTITDFERELDEELAGKLSDDPTKKIERGEAQEEAFESRETSREPSDKEESDEVKKYREFIEKKLHKDDNDYERYRREVLPIIDQLEQDLREIFVSRRSGQWESGFRSGKRIDIKRRIQEKAKGVSVMESKAWEKRELPQEKDYAVTLLADLSGSMRGQKIEETFKAVIVLTEVLNRLSIQTEILGFNDKIYEYQKFGEDISNLKRENMGSMLGEVSSSGAIWNDDGWALDQASERLAKQKAKEKFLIVLSDGIPEESPAHSAEDYELGSVVQKVVSSTDQKLVGLGIGPDTNHVNRYYPNSISNVGVKEISRKLADLIREAIANFDKF
ncbi:hypothetical protein COY62_00395 [bacterium (Candidatus Howlettbacteria) CG_4_10_14_0_8_um_filter_40_9]|nr:MAG: hypothetical protein COY62_00395 [bacterium (Candidatus Howlettbacteria) CG_4_10_14_0_8_um_filter_40_9]